MGEVVDFAGDVAFDAADGFSAGLAFGQASFQVVAGALVPAQTAEHDAVEGGVGLAVTASVEPASLGLAGGRFDGADAAQRREGGLSSQPFGVVAGRDEQGGGAVGADADALQQLRAMSSDGVSDASLQVAGFGGELLDAASQQPQHVDSCRMGRVGATGVGFGQVRAAADESLGAQAGQRLAQAWTWRSS